MKFREPFYIMPAEGEKFSVAAYLDGGDFRVFDCADADIANELAAAMNLVWQVCNYGMADPKAVEQFGKDYGRNGWDGECAASLMLKLAEIDMIPPNFGVTSLAKH